MRGAAVVVVIGTAGPVWAQDDATGGDLGGDTMQGDAQQSDRSAIEGEDGGSEPAVMDAAGDGGQPPVISSEDSGVGDDVMEGPSEQAGAFAGWDDGAGSRASDAGTDAAAAAAAPGAPRAAESAGFVEEGAMMMNRLVAPAASLSARSAAKARDPAANPVVVELFTSQGCSSCPAADALLGELANRPDVLTLSFHVDYWDYLGWPDQFARPEFTARQRAYGRVTGERALYTPQIVVGGIDTLIDLGPASLEALIEAHQAEPSPVAMQVEVSDGRISVQVSPGAVPTGASAVELVRYLPEREVSVGEGENSGRVLEYRNVVVSVDRLATWDGRAPVRLTVTPGAGGSQPYPADTRHAVLVQQLVRSRGLGPVLAAVPID